MARATHRGRKRIRKDQGGDIDKGLRTGQLEAGIHAHVLERELETTAADGAHRHVFRLPNGSLVVTEEDGGHRHRLESYGRHEEVCGGQHAHKIIIEGVELSTEMDGWHNHATQLETTALDGSHTHMIQLPDGTTIESLLPKEQWALAGSPATGSTGTANAEGGVEGADGRPMQAPLVPELTGSAKASLRFEGELAKLDFRVTNSHAWNGWALDIGRELEDEPLNVAEGVELTKAFDVRGTKHYRPLLEAEVPARMLSKEQAEATVYDRERDERGHLTFEVESFEVEFGLQTENVREFFLVGKSVSGRMLMLRCEGEWTARLTHTGMPAVLIKGAPFTKLVKTGGPAPGIPQSLQKVVPENLRWWEETDEAAAAAKRDFLVNTMFFSEENIVLVDKRLTKVEVEKSYFAFEPDTSPWMAAVAKLFPSGSKVVSPFAEEDWRTVLEKTADTEAIIVMDPPDPAEFTADRLVRCVKHRAGQWLLAHVDTPEAREAFGKVGRVFKLHHPAAFDRLFVASFPVAAEALWIGKREDVGKPFAGYKDFAACVADQKDGGKDDEAARKICGALQAEAETEKAKKKPKADLEINPDTPGYKQPDQGGDKERRRRKAEIDALLAQARLIRKQEDEESEERFVYGIVLEPDGVDAQDDTISAPEIRTAAHKFMEDFQNLGLQHMRFINGKAKILESFIAPEDVRIGGELVKKGTWMFGVRVLDDNIWKAIKEGLITGFSIGGSAIREPVEDA